MALSQRFQAVNGEAIWSNLGKSHTDNELHGRIARLYPFYFVDNSILGVAIELNAEDLKMLLQWSKGCVHETLEEVLMYMVKNPAHSVYYVAEQ